MGDASLKKLKDKVTSTITGETVNRDLIQDIIDKGVLNPDLRDEIFVQLCRQTNGHPKLFSHLSSFTSFSVLTAFFCTTQGALHQRMGTHGSLLWMLRPFQDLH
jgi:hypothetical protein